LNQTTDTVFTALVKAELAGFKEFHQLLQQEQGALIKGDVDQLLRLADHKSGLVEKLAELNDQRSHHMNSVGCENSAPGIAAYFDAIKAQTATRELWGELLNLVREVDQVNRSNGILINTRLLHNQQALSVLKSAANPGASLYGPDGQISSAASGRRLDKA
jgi:flagella synthesis protein FlgN